MADRVLSESWRENLNSAQTKESKTSVMAKLQPGDAGKGKEAKTRLKKALMKPVSQM